MGRNAKVERKTAETEVSVSVGLDGEGKGDIATSIPFLDHMLSLLSRHGFLDLTVQSAGDTEVDDYHLI